jgi:hypothetical protein
LAVIVATLEYDAKCLMSIWEQNRIREQRAQAIQRINEEKEKRKADELKKFKGLLTSTRRFVVAQRIREYLDSIEQKAAKGGGLTEELQRWIQWAKAKADWYDPLVNALDEIIGPFKDTPD